MQDTAPKKMMIVWSSAADEWLVCVCVGMCERETKKKNKKKKKEKKKKKNSKKKTTSKKQKNKTNKQKKKKKTNKQNKQTSENHIADIGGVTFIRLSRWNHQGWSEIERAPVRLDRSALDHHTVHAGESQA